MAAPALLSDLPKGHEFPATELQITAEDVSAYLDAVQDANSVYRDCGFAPPLAVAARALGALLDLIELPPGTLHTGQQIESAAGVPLGAPLTLSARLTQRSERAGLIIFAIEYAVTVAPATAYTMPALTGKTTMMVTAGAAT